MKKRIISIVLTLALVLIFVPFGGIRASAASEFTVSQQCLEMIKELEGFSAKPYWDYSQWTVGYGTRAPDEHLARYKSEGISKEEALQLLDEFMTNMGRSINSFIDKFGLTMTQNQFDALLSFTFNCGSSWLYQSSLFRTAVIEGETGNDFLFKMGQWSNAGGSIQKGLVRRRLVEANMYLNGIYDMTVPENYCYVLYNANGGSTDIRVQAYDSNLTAQPKPVATYEGYTFAGWYTDPAGGDKIETLDASVRNYTLYAHWTAGDGADLPQDTTAQEITGSPVDYTREITAAVLNAFDKPVKGALVVNAYKQGVILDVLAEYTDGNGVKWGKVANGGWINLAHTQEPSGATGTGVQVQVTTDDVNVRQGPGTDYKSVGKANTGDKLVITQTATGSGYTWGKFERGWICLKYTDYDSVANGNDTPSQTVKGTVKVSSSLRVRSGAGTSYDVAGFLTNGTKVEILEQKTVDGVLWGRISKGWISMEYVELDDTTTEPPATEPPATEPPATEPPATEPPATEPPATEPPATEPPATEPPATEPPATEPPATEPPATEPPATEPPATEPPATEPPATEPPATEPPATEPPATEPPATEPPAKKQMGTITGNKLRIRSGPSTGHSVLGYLNKGDRVEVLEQKTVGSSQWARIPAGWVSMSYVKMDAPDTGSDSGNTGNSGNTGSDSGNSGTNSGGNTGSSGVLTGVISGTSQLRVRSGPGTNYSVAGYLNKGTRVEITEQKQGGSILWGKTAKGWVSMNYVKLDANSENSGGSTGGNTSSGENSGGSTAPTGTLGTVKVSSLLRIRSGPGTSYAIAGYVSNGDQVRILQTKEINGITWGQIDKGWISMKYVQLSGSNSGGNTSGGTTSGGTSSGNTDSGTASGKTGTATMSLCIRSGAGTGNKVVGYLAEGATVTILETKQVSGITWGRISKGWISLKYVK